MSKVESKSQNLKALNQIKYAKNDVDVATSAEFDRVLEILRGADLENIKIEGIQAAEAYPVVIAKAENAKIEIVSFRKDTYESEVVEQVGKKRRSVKTKTGATLLEDVERRDLTINTTMFDPRTRQIIDPLSAIEGEKPQSGVADLENKIIRFVGDARERIIEDRIRMIRAIRFKNRYSGFSYAPETSQVLTELAGEVSNISGERIREELIKTLSGPNRAQSMEDLSQFGILQIILPELVACQNVEQPKELHSEGDVWQHVLLALENLPENPSENLIWATLLHDIGKVKTQKFDEQKGRIIFHGHEQQSVELARVILRERFAFANDQIAKILWLIENHMDIRGIAEMRPNKQKALALPHRVNAKIKSKSLTQDLLGLLWVDNQASVRSDSAVDQESFYRAEEIIEKIIQESASIPLSIKDGLGIDGKILIDALEIERNQQNWISKLVLFLNEPYQDDPSLNREQIMEMAQTWWQENVLAQ